MENIDLVVLRATRDWRLAGKQALLATVIRTWGSSPRPVGSIMALSEDGAVAGSVSGGCIEDDLIYRYTGAYPRHSDTAFPASGTRLVSYGVGADEAHRFGLPCGGTLELLLEFNPDGGALAELVEQLEAGKLMRRRVQLSTGEASLEETSSPEVLSTCDQALTNTFGPEFRMLLIGAGQLAEYLATMALFNGFAVLVCDPREEYRGSWSVPAASVLPGMPDDVVRDFRPDGRSCVIALTHDPKLDDLALLEALNSNAFYVGAIGSRRNNEARHARLKEHFDQTDEDLQRLRGPIGIYIGSKTPAEIAVSVMAEVLAVKNSVDLPRAMLVSGAKNLRSVVESEGLVCL